MAIEVENSLVTFLPDKESFASPLSCEVSEAILPEEDEIVTSRMLVVRSILGRKTSDFDNEGTSHVTGKTTIGVSRLSRVSDVEIGTIGETPDDAFVRRAVGEQNTVSLLKLSGKETQLRRRDVVRRTAL